MTVPVGPGLDQAGRPRTLRFQEHSVYIPAGDIVLPRPGGEPWVQLTVARAEAAKQTVKGTDFDPKHFGCIAAAVLRVYIYIYTLQTWGFPSILCSL